jgi:hypothetical protein
MIDGKQAFLTAADRNLMSILYAKNIKKDIKIHQEVLKKINANKGFINMKIENFIKSKLWEKLSFDERADKVAAI